MKCYFLCMLSALFVPLPLFTSSGFKPFPEQKLLLTYCSWNRVSLRLSGPHQTYLFCSTDHRSLHKLLTIVGTEATLPFNLLKLRIHQACGLFPNVILLKFQTRIRSSDFLFLIFVPLTVITHHHEQFIQTQWNKIKNKQALWPVVGLTNFPDSEG